MRYQIFIEGHEMDVDDKSTKIATTLQHFDFLNVGASVKAPRTNRISLPLTGNNIRHLEQIAPLSVITDRPYRNLSIKITHDLDVLPVGICQITGISDRIELVAQSAVKSFFGALEGLYLNDLDLSAYNGLWTDARRDTLRSATSGLISPVIDSGQMVDGGTYVDLYTHGRANIPFVYYHTIMDQIFDLLGYSKSGRVFTDSRYLAMAMSTRLVFNEQWLAKKEFTAIYPGTKNYPALGGPHTIEYTSVVKNEDGFMNPVTGEYTVVNADTALEYFKGVFRFSARISGVYTALEIHVNGVAVSVTGVANGDITTMETGVIELKDGDVVAVVLTTILGDVDVTNATLSLKTSNTTDTELAQNTDWYIYFNQLLPRILLKDFIRDFMNMFGLVCREKNGTVEFKFIEDALQGLNDSLDYAPTTAELARRDASDPQDLNYELPGFGQLNEYYWIVQEDEAFIQEDHGKGVFALDNDTLPDVEERFESLFTASETTSRIRIKDCAKCVIYDQAGPDFTKAASFGFRLLMMRDDDGAAVRFVAGTSRTDYKIGYFIDDNQAMSLDLQQFLDTYYPTYIKTLERYESVTDKFVLTLAEFVNADLFLLKQREGVLFLLVAIDNYIAGMTSKFRMIRVPTGSVDEGS